MTGSRTTPPSSAHPPVHPQGRLVVRHQGPRHDDGIILETSIPDLPAGEWVRVDALVGQPGGYAIVDMRTGRQYAAHRDAHQSRRSLDRAYTLSNAPEFPGLPVPMTAPGSSDGQ